jgi:hypothetical protein
MFIPAPEIVTWIQFPEPWVLFEHPFRTVRLEHILCLFKRIALGNICLEMHVNACETELPKLESERFEFTESLGAGVDVGLFSETVASALGVKFHGYPVVPCVMRQLFIITTPLCFPYFLLLLSHQPKGRRMPAACNKKRYGSSREKRDSKKCGSSADASDHAVFPAAVNK